MPALGKPRRQQGERGTAQGPRDHADHPVDRGRDPLAEQAGCAEGCGGGEDRAEDHLALGSDREDARPQRGDQGEGDDRDRHCPDEQLTDTVRRARHSGDQPLQAGQWIGTGDQDEYRRDNKHGDDDGAREHPPAKSADHGCSP